MRPFTCVSKTFAKTIVVIALLIVAFVIIIDCVSSKHAYASLTSRLSQQAHENWSNIAEYDAFEILLNKANDSSASLRLVCIKKKRDKYGAVYVLDVQKPYLQPLFDPNSSTLRMQRCQ